MGSKASAGSSKFGPNRSSPNQAPPKEDRLVESATRTSFEYKHGGAIQAVGNILGVTMDQARQDNIPAGKVLFYDVSNPENPVLKKELSRSENVGAAGLTKLANGNFLMVVGGFDDNKKLDFYELNNDLDSLRRLQRDKDSDGVVEAGHGGCWPYDTWYQTTSCGNSYQSLSLVTQCGDGKVFLIGMHAKTSLGSGYDRADLYELTLSGDKIKPKKVYESYDFKCGRWSGGGDQCSFAAAGGIYIDPAGKLILYGVEHDNDGPRGSGEAQNSVKMVEFYYD
jgi:hypothetical protein